MPTTERRPSTSSIPHDPIINAWRHIFPQLFKDAADMPQDLRKHVRYPELLLRMQAAAYGLYHMTDPVVFYNREDLWTVASEVGIVLFGRAGRATHGSQLRADEASRRVQPPSSSRSFPSPRPIATT